jgi:hypothetical protein
VSVGAVGVATIASRADHVHGAEEHAAWEWDALIKRSASGAIAAMGGRVNEDGSITVPRIHLETHISGRGLVTRTKTIMPVLTTHEQVAELYGSAFASGLPLGERNLSLYALVNDAIKRTEEAMSVRMAARERALEKTVSDAIRRLGISEDEIAEVLADKSRFSVDVDGRVVFATPWRVEAVVYEP